MNTQALFRFHIGLDDRRGNPTREHQRSRALGLLAETYPDGYTLSEVSGRWKGANEPAWIVEVYGDASEHANERARKVAREVRDAMDQEAVGLAVLPVTFQLV